MSYLLPCPFCGSAGRLLSDFPSDNARKQEFKVICSNMDCPCSPETQFNQFPTSAIEQWNTRDNALITRVEAADIAKNTGGDPEVWDRLFGITEVE